MSRGNLAYHFKFKETILDSIATIMKEDITALQLKRKSYPAFYNLHLDIRTSRILQRRYPFVFRDMSVLEYGSIKTLMSGWSELTIDRYKEAFAYGVSVANIIEEPFDGIYNQLAVNAWLVSYYWLAQQAVREVGPSKPEKVIWSSIMPYFTEKGLVEFGNYYGEAFKESLGKPLEKFEGPLLATIKKL